MSDSSEYVLPEQLARTVVDPHAYADWPRLHEALRRIRAEHPFARGEVDGYNPFWVAAKFDDIRAIARANEVFRSGMGGILDNKSIAFERAAGIGKLFRSVVAMNEPDHHKYRLLTQGWFQPGNVRKLETRVRALAEHWVLQLRAAPDGTCDFVSDIAAHYPLLVVMSILGIPEQDEPMMLRLTREYFGETDAELNRERREQSPEARFESVARVIAEANDYFAGISAARRAEPQDDLATVIANAVIDGRPISDADAMGYYITVAFAGHDTTSSSLAGGLWALAENPEQLAKVQADPSLIPNLVEESVRWTTPIHQFTRIAAQDAEIRGATVRRGDFVVLSFPSGNRDEDVFEDPFTFRVDRRQNTHVGFGYGAHMCLGMHLARLELRVFYETLLPQLRSVSLAGTPMRTVTNFVGGPKRLPLKFEFK